LALNPAFGNRSRFLRFHPWRRNKNLSRLNLLDSDLAHQATDFLNAVGIDARDAVQAGKIGAGRSLESRFL